MPGSIWKWIIFNAFVLAMLALDLGVFHRRAHAIKLREALLWSVVWIALALAYCTGVHFWLGRQKALEFLTGYVIEKSLSVDNIFVFVVLFNYFRVPGRDQHKVLFWGILGALLMRGIFIAAGVTLIQQFHWIIYIFGAILVVSGVKMAVSQEKQIDPERNPVLRLFRKLIPVTEQYENDRFWVRRDARLWATPLLAVVLVVETTDLIFAVDSIPAVLAITHDPFIVYTSNVFAILGLRALYFALAAVMDLFHYLHYGLALILVFVGGKMLASGYYKIPTGIALLVVLAVLVLSVAASLLWPQKRTTK